MPCSLTAVICLFSQACCYDCCFPLLLPLCPGYQDSRPQSSKPSSLPKVTVVTGLLCLLSEVCTHSCSGADVTAQCFPPGRKQHRTLHAVLLDQPTRESLPSPGPGKQHSCMLSSTNQGPSVPLAQHVSCFPSGPPSVATCPSAIVPVPATNPLLFLFPLCPSCPALPWVTPQVQRQVRNRSGWHIA